MKKDFNTENATLPSFSVVDSWHIKRHF